MSASVFMRDRVDRYTEAINKAEPIGNNDLSWNKSVPGFTIISTPINPITIATILWIPIFTPRIGSANKEAILVHYEQWLYFLKVTSILFQKYRAQHILLLKKLLRNAWLVFLFLLNLYLNDKAWIKILLIHLMLGKKLHNKMGNSWLNVYK